MTKPGKSEFKPVTKLAAMFAKIPGEQILASNTSSISITQIAACTKNVKGERVAASEQIIGMHFFNPVPVMKLVEVIKGLSTSQRTMDRTIALAGAMGKTPIPANYDLTVVEAVLKTRGPLLKIETYDLRDAGTDNVLIYAGNSIEFTGDGGENGIN